MQFCKDKLKQGAKRVSSEKPLSRRLWSSKPYILFPLQNYLIRPELKVFVLIPHNNEENILSQLPCFTSFQSSTNCPEDLTREDAVWTMSECSKITRPLGKTT